MTDNATIINMIEAFIKKHGAINCYVGITDDYKRRYREHKVTGSEYKYSDTKCDVRCGDAETEENAGDIEQSFLDKYKPENIKGKGGGGKGKSKYVYIYKIVPGVTDEEA